MVLNPSFSDQQWKALRSVHPWKGALLLLGDWLVIGLAIWALVALEKWWLYPLVVVVIGSRMMGLWALLHDGHHNMLLRSKNLNRRLTEWLIAWPLFRSMQEYDQQHSMHHKHLGRQGDPNIVLLNYEEFQFPMKKMKLLSILLKDAFGLNFLRYRVLGILKDPLVVFSKLSRWSSERKIYVLSLLVIVFYFDLWAQVLLFWFVPLVTYFQFLIRVTLIADHCFAGESASKVRSVKLSWVERIFMVPHNLNYHFEHHHFGGIPSYNLSRLHKALAQEEHYAELADLSNGYTEVFRKVTQVA